MAERKPMVKPGCMRRVLALFRAVGRACPHLHRELYVTESYGKAQYEVRVQAKYEDIPGLTAALPDSMVITRKFVELRESAGGWWEFNATDNNGVTFCAYAVSNIPNCRIVAVEEVLPEPIVQTITKRTRYVVECAEGEPIDRDGALVDDGARG